MKNLELQRYVLGPVGTNCYFLKNKETNEILIIDPAESPETIFKKILSMGGIVKGILLTHGHYDHITAADAVRKEYQVPIYAHEAEEELLLDCNKNLSAYGKTVSIKADVLLEDLQVLEIAGFSIQVLHTPGHTPGCCCYYIAEEEVLFSGDTLFCGSVGRTDFPGGSVHKIVESLHRLLDSLPEKTDVYPGHDVPTTIGYEKRYNPFV